ncbi:MAG: efflux RND transporter periplasmic adaptor subunit, partial [Planctomycetes bacterium]|nr:efflux RND transporter periplasmic adaptor subunit [Planctomycetota bacterium]
MSVDLLTTAHGDRLIEPPRRPGGDGGVWLWLVVLGHHQPTPNFAPVQSLVSGSGIGAGDARLCTGVYRDVYQNVQWSADRRGIDRGCTWGIGTTGASMLYAPEVPMTTATKIPFTCSACGYRARIPDRCAGQRLRCPGCDQVVVVDEAHERSGEHAIVGTATSAREQSRIPSTPSPSAKAPPSARKRFDCAACGLSGLISAELAGERVSCPRCKTVQLVGRGDGVASGSRSVGDTIGFTCRACEHRARLSAALVGDTISCPSCAAPQVVEASAQVDAGANARSMPASDVGDAAGANCSNEREQRARRELQLRQERQLAAEHQQRQAQHRQRLELEQRRLEQELQWRELQQQREQQRLEETHKQQKQREQQRLVDEQQRFDREEQERQAPDAEPAETQEPERQPGPEQQLRSELPSAYPRPQRRSRQMDDEQTADRPASAGGQRARPRPQRSNSTIGCMALCAMALAGYWYIQLPSVPTPVTAAVVPTETVATTTPQGIRATGTVVAASEVEVRCLAKGRLASIRFAVGDVVADGAIVAEVDPTEEEREVHRFVAQSLLSDAALAQSQQNLIIAQQEQEVGQRSAQAVLASSESRARDAHKRSAALEKLLVQKLVSRLEASTAHELALQADADLEGARTGIAALVGKKLALSNHRQAILIAETQAQSDRVA